MARNFVYIEGKLVDYVIKKIGEGKRVAQITMACYNGREQKPAYYNVEFWNPPVEQSKELKSIKGEGRIAVSGELRQDRWESKDGQKRSMVKIVAFSVSVAFEVPPREDDDEGRGKGRSNFRGGKPSRPRDDDDDDSDSGDDDEDKEKDEDEDEKEEDRGSKKGKDRRKNEDEDVPF